MNWVLNANDRTVFYNFLIQTRTAYLLKLQSKIVVYTLLNQFV